jgi:hypothetical protein
MSLSKTSLLTIVKKQYVYKLQAYSQVFMSLVLIQLLAIFFSLNGSGMMGGGSNILQVDVHFYSADFVVIFTMLWSFINAITITTQANKNGDFAFITNRISSNLANMLFLLTASIVGGITAMLSGYLIRTLMFVFGRIEYFSNPIALSDWLIGFSATILYVLLCAALGYFCGTLVQLNKVFAILLPGFFVGLLILAGSMNGEFMVSVFKFIFTESSITLFFIKIMVLASLLFSGSIVLSNDMEVR